MKDHYWEAAEQLRGENGYPYEMMPLLYAIIKSAKGNFPEANKLIQEAGKVGSPKSSFSGSSPKLQMKATRLSSSKSSILSPDKSPESSCNGKVSDSDHYSSHLAAASDPSPPPRDHRISPCFDNSPSKSQRVSRRYRFDSNIDVPSAIHLTSYTTPRFLSKDSELLPPRPPLPVDFPYFSPWYPAALAQWCQQRHHQEAFISNLKPKPGVEGLQDQVFMRHC